MSLYVGDIAFSITNHSLTLLIVFVFAFIIPLSIIDKKDRSILIIPNVPQPGLKLIYSYVMKYTNILQEKVQVYSLSLAPFFILVLNLLYFIPYTLIIIFRFVLSLTIATTFFLISLLA